MGKLGLIGGAWTAIKGLGTAGLAWGAGALGIEAVTNEGNGKGGTPTQLGRATADAGVKESSAVQALNASWDAIGLGRAKIAGFVSGGLAAFLEVVAHFTGSSMVGGWAEKARGYQFKNETTLQEMRVQSRANSIMKDDGITGTLKKGIETIVPDALDGGDTNSLAVNSAGIAAGGGALYLAGRKLFGGKKTPPANKAVEEAIDSAKNGKPSLETTSTTRSRANLPAGQTAPTGNPVQNMARAAANNAADDAAKAAATPAVAKAGILSRMGSALKGAATGVASKIPYVKLLVVGAGAGVIATAANADQFNEVSANTTPLTNDTDNGHQIDISEQGMSLLDEYVPAVGDAVNTYNLVGEGDYQEAGIVGGAAATSFLGAAFSGAVVGGAVGTVVPVFGNVAGFIAGGITGLVTYKIMDNKVEGTLRASFGDEVEPQLTVASVTDTGLAGQNAQNDTGHHTWSTGTTGPT